MDVVEMLLMLAGGLSLFLLGMNSMGNGLETACGSKMKSILKKLTSNRLVGVLVGMVVTAIIQSSSASVGILQALAMSGAIKLNSAVFVLFGMNIGTCITALLASIGTNRNAKRTTLIHFMFNVIGTVLFTLICVIFPRFITYMEGLTSSPALQIANMHTIFNIVTTILLLPFGLYLVKLAEKILPDKVIEDDSIFMFLNHDKNIRIGNSSLHIENLKQEVKRMYAITKESIELGFENLINPEANYESKINKNEDLIDKLNEGIIKYITLNLQTEVNIEVSATYSAYLSISNNLERLSDHVMNIVYEIKEMSEKNITLSEKTIEEIKEMKDVILEMTEKAMDPYFFNEIKDLETKTDKLTVLFRENTFSRLKDSICTAEGSIVYSTLLINFERIGDHLLNVSEDVVKL